MLLSDFMHDEHDEIRARVYKGKVQVVYLRADHTPVGSAEVDETEEGALEAAAQTASNRALDASGAEVIKAQALLNKWTADNAAFQAFAAELRRRTALTARR